MFVLYGLRLVIGIVLITLAVICAVLPFLLSMQAKDAGRCWAISLASMLSGLWLVHL